MRQLDYLLEGIEIRCSIPIELYGQQYNTKVHPGHYHPGYGTCQSHSDHRQHLQESASDGEDIVRSRIDKYGQRGQYLHHHDTQHQYHSNNLYNNIKHFLLLRYKTYTYKMLQTIFVMTNVVFRVNGKKEKCTLPEFKLSTSICKIRFSAREQFDNVTMDFEVQIILFLCG